MPPESFDRSKTDLQSLLRSGTWLYKCGQGTVPFPNPLSPASPFDLNDLNNDSRTVDPINFQDVDSEDFPLNTFSFDSPEEHSDRSLQDHPPLEQPFSTDLDFSLPIAARQNGYPLDYRSTGLASTSRGEWGQRPWDKGHWSKGQWKGQWGKGQWRWLFLVLGVLVPMGILKGIEGFAPMPLPQSASRLSAPVSPRVVLNSKTTPDDPVAWATEEADRASVLISTAQTSEDWQAIVTVWQNTIERLEGISAIDPHYKVAQDRLVAYRSQLDYATNQWQSLERVSQVLAEQDEIFRVAVRSALQAADWTQTARTPQEWQRVAQFWQAAIDGMGQISVQSPHYAVAQDRISTYTQNLNYARNNARSNAQ